MNNERTVDHANTDVEPFICRADDCQWRVVVVRVIVLDVIRTVKKSGENKMRKDVDIYQYGVYDAAGVLRDHASI